MARRRVSLKNYGIYRSIFPLGLGGNTLGLSFMKRIKYQRILKTLGQNPKVMYLGVGLGVVVLGRMIFRYYKAHPEMMEFVRDQVQIFEKKMKRISPEKSSIEIV
jgi:hypothetical protein